MNTTRFYMYNETRLLMLQKRRRAVLRLMVVRLLGLASLFFVLGYLQGCLS